ncbi:MAG: hypothetical protein ACQESE_02780 [Nanobdellota archaeon]
MSDTPVRKLHPEHEFIRVASQKITSDVGNRRSLKSLQLAHIISQMNTSQKRFERTSAVYLMDHQDFNRMKESSHITQYDPSLDEYEKLVIRDLPPDMTAYGKKLFIEMDWRLSQESLSHVPSLVAGDYIIIPFVKGVPLNFLVDKAHRELDADRKAVFKKHIFDAFLEADLQFAPVSDELSRRFSRPLSRKRLRLASYEYKHNFVKPITHFHLLYNDIVSTRKLEHQLSKSVFSPKHIPFVPLLDVSYKNFIVPCSSYVEGIDSLFSSVIEDGLCPDSLKKIDFADVFRTIALPHAVAQKYLYPDNGLSLDDRFGSYMDITCREGFSLSDTVFFGLQHCLSRSYKHWDHAFSQHSPSELGQYYAELEQKQYHRRMASEYFVQGNRIADDFLSSNCYLSREAKNILSQFFDSYSPVLGSYSDDA